MGYTKKQLETAMMMLLTDTLSTMDCEKVKKEGTMYCSRCDECMMAQYIKKSKEHLKLYKAFGLSTANDPLTYYAYEILEEKRSKAYDLEGIAEEEALEEGEAWLTEDVLYQKIKFINAYGFTESKEIIRLDHGQKPYGLKEELRNAKYYR